MTPSIEYGVRDTDGEIVWTDEDGELYLGGRWLDAIGDVDEKELLTAARRAGKVLVKRRVTLGEPEEVAEPLPPVGSIVVADTVSPMYGDLGRTPLRVQSSASHPYVVVSERHYGAGIPASGVTNAETVYEAKAVGA